MDKEFERYLIVFLVIILISLSGCIQPTLDIKKSPKLPDTVSNPTEEDKDFTPSIGNMEGIANALGCMFSPSTFEAKKDLGTTEDK